MGNHQPMHTVVRQHARCRREPAARIDHHAGRVGPGDAADGQLRIVGERGADADDDGIHQRAQAMQMGEAFRSVDVVRMSAGSGDPGVDRLSALGDDHHVVDQAAAQRPEYLFPRRGE